MLSETWAFFLKTLICPDDTRTRSDYMDDDVIWKEVKVASDTLEKNEQECNRFFREAFQGSGGSGLVSAWVPVAALPN